MRLILPLLFLLAGCAPAGMGGGGGIVSTNPCADAMLRALVPPSRIAAVSAYSQSPSATSVPLAWARQFRATSGTAEEVLALHPDLILTSSFTAPATRDAYARAGVRTLLLDSPTSIAASEAQVRAVAAAVGAPARGEALVARIEAALSATMPAGKQRPRALLFIAGDLVSGSGTLLDELLRRTGFRDAAADYGLAHTGTLPVETLVARPPDVILSPDGADGRTARLRRSVMAHLTSAPADADFPRSLVNCGGPTIIAAVRRLADVRRQVVR